MDVFQQHGYFDGLLSQDLVRDFVGANQTPIRLDDRFQFGVRYRFVPEGTTEDSEAGAALLVVHNPAVPVHAPSVLDRLAFSRVGRTLRNDQALVYVENRRRDGTGAGFLVSSPWTGVGTVRHGSGLDHAIGGSEAEGSYLALEDQWVVACSEDDGLDSENLLGSPTRL